MSNFKESAFASYQARKRRDEEELKKEKEELEKRTRADFVKKFGVEPDEIDENQVKIDGLTFRQTWNDYSYIWQYIAPCPTCGKLVPDNNQITSLADVGHVLQKEFRPSWKHRCQAKVEVTLSTGDKLLDALRDYIDSRVGRGVEY